MSDGNYNRALLRPGGLQSGLLMGKRIARQQAIEAFDKYYTYSHPAATHDEIADARTTFLSFFG